MAGAEYRAATPADAAVVAELFDMAVGGLAAYRWSERAGKGADVLAFAHKLVAEGEGRLSFRNATIAEVDGEVVGVMVGRFEPLASFQSRPDLEKSPIKPWSELEALAGGMWLLRAVAVRAEYRGQGIARTLLAKAEELARKSGSGRLAIIAAEENSAVVTLYRNYGFETLARRAVVPWPGAPHNGDWVLLVKKV
jgi:ribosomal protein S18 acetylase RimI-like enzyme